MITFKNEDSRSVQMYYIDGVKEKCLGCVNKKGDVEEQFNKLLNELPLDHDIISKYEVAKREIAKRLNEIVE